MKKYLLILAAVIGFGISANASDVTVSEDGHFSRDVFLKNNETGYTLYLFWDGRCSYSGVVAGKEGSHTGTYKINGTSITFKWGNGLFSTIDSKLYLDRLIIVLHGNRFSEDGKS